MPLSLRPSRPVTLACLISVLAACGGGSADGSQSPGTYANVRGWLDLGTNRVSLTWDDVVADATRYQIEQQDQNGAWVVIDAVWAAHGQPPGVLVYQSPEWHGLINTPTTLRVEAVTPNALVPFSTLDAFYYRGGTTLTFAPPASLPSIELDQPEPLKSSTQVTLGNAATNLLDAFAVDVLPSPGFPGAQAALTLDAGGLTTGTHVIYAIFEAPQSAVSYVISRTVQTYNSKLAVSALETVQNVNAFDEYLLASSDAGIASIVASVNGVPMVTVTAPNACLPRPCAAGQSLNGYRLSVNTQDLAPGGYTLVAVATDNAGNTASAPGHFNLPGPTMAGLDSPVDGAVVSGTLHVSGKFASATPGALEVMVTLNGIPAYDKTVANTGEAVPFAADISLAGVTPGYHTLGVYARVGNTPYTAAASILVQVAAAP
jgi:hypothetical protein